MPCKISKKSRKSKREYNATAELRRLKSRLHSCGVEVLKQLEYQGLRQHKCECCEEVENLECHHKNLQPTDNRPENLTWVCRKHHSELHSVIEKSVKSSEYSKESLYGETYGLFGSLLK